MLGIPLGGADSEEQPNETTPIGSSNPGMVTNAFLFPLLFLGKIIHAALFRMVRLVLALCGSFKTTKTVGEFLPDVSNTIG